MQPELLSQTRALIAGCDCDNGCPICVGPIGETGPLAKTVALRMLQHLLAASLDDGSADATAKPSLSERGKKRSRSSMATLDRLRDIVKNTGRRFRSFRPRARSEGDGFSRRHDDDDSAGAEALALRTAAADHASTPRSRSAAPSSNAPTAR